MQSRDIADDWEGNAGHDRWTQPGSRAVGCERGAPLRRSDVMAGGRNYPGLRTATRGGFATGWAIRYAMASMIALKVPLGRIAFDVFTGSGS